MFVNRYLATTFCVAVLAANAAAGDDTEQAARERKLVDMLSGTVLVGEFSIDGMKLDKSPFPERYELKSVEKAGDGLWTFTARVTFLKLDVTVPVTVPVEWAGDTPMISLTDGTLKGLGSALSARVIFHDDKYAGTWKHGAFAGHMWGKIVREPTDDSEADAAE